MELGRKEVPDDIYLTSYTTFNISQFFHVLRSKSNCF